MTPEEERLQELRKRMTQGQRKQMAEIVQNEMKRRGLSLDDEPKQGAQQVQMESKKPMATKPGAGLSRDQVGELYGDISDAVRQLRVKKVDQKLEKVRKARRSSPLGVDLQMPKMFQRSARPAQELLEESSARGESNTPKYLMFGGIVALGAMKVFFSLGIGSDPVSASGAVAEELTAPVVSRAATKPEVIGDRPTSSKATPAMAMNVVPVDASVTERQIFLELDNRRVQLEGRKDALDRRELDLRNQAQALSERLAELRSLTAKLADAHKEKDHRYESRMEQLANVYGAMSPQEAAGLIGRLEDPTAIELLQRMPEKRMGQILSFMDKERAVDLTRILTEHEGIL